MTGKYEEFGVAADDDGMRQTRALITLIWNITRFISGEQIEVSWWWWCSDTKDMKFISQNKLKIF